MSDLRCVQDGLPLEGYWYECRICIGSSVVSNNKFHTYRIHLKINLLQRFIWYQFFYCGTMILFEIFFGVVFNVDNCPTDILKFNIFMIEKCSVPIICLLVCLSNVPSLSYTFKLCLNFFSSICGCVWSNSSVVKWTMQMIAYTYVSYISIKKNIDKRPSFYRYYVCPYTNFVFCMTSESMSLLITIALNLHVLNQIHITYTPPK